MPRFSKIYSQDVISWHSSLRDIYLMASFLITISAFTELIDGPLSPDAARINKCPLARRGMLMRAGGIYDSGRDIFDSIPARRRAAEAAKR